MALTARKPLKKQLLEANISQWLLAFIACAYVLCVRFTSRVIYINRNVIKKQHTAGDKLIFTLWHGRLILMPFIFKDIKNVSALMSASKDGKFTRKAASFYGIGSITGSSSNGGAVAIRNMLRHLKKSGTVFMTPDGPRGPRMHLQPGAIELARLSRGYVVPVAITVKHAKILKSWDSFMLPRLFNTIVVQYGAPIQVLSKDDSAQAMQTVESEMTDMQQTLDSQFATFSPVRPSTRK